MTVEEVKVVMEKVCPEMLTHDNFMKNVIYKYCGGEFINRTTISDDEFEVWCKLSEILGTLTVGQLLKYLKENFKPTDKLCYMDCVEGCKNDCTYITKDQLGERFFYYVKKLKDRNMSQCHSTKEQEDEIYPFVNDNDIVVC